jgi:hypothetical protein
MKFSDCIDQADSIISASEKFKTKIYLAATAGMRLLEYLYFFKVVLKN